MTDNISTVNSSCFHSYVTEPLRSFGSWTWQRADNLKKYLPVLGSVASVAAWNFGAQGAILGASAVAIGLGAIEYAKTDPVEPLSERVADLTEDMSPLELPAVNAVSSDRVVSTPGLNAFLKKLAFRIVTVFKSIILLIISISLFIAGASIVWLPPTRNLGKDLLENGVLGLRVLRDTVVNGFTTDPFFNSFQLLQNDQGTFQSEFSWYLNLGLLRASYEATDDPRLKEQIEFIAVNYLAKAAPYNTEKLRYLSSNFDLVNQVPAGDKSLYHRTSCRGQIELGEKFNQRLAIGSESPLILTDTAEVGHLFKLRFEAFSSENGSWEQSLKGTLDAHFAKNTETPFDQPLPCLIDLTSEFEDCIYDKTESEQAQEILAQFRGKIQKLSEWIATQNPNLDQRKVHQFILDHLTVVARVNLGDIGGIKVLPLDPSITGQDLVANRSTFFDFISATGLYINRISLVRHVLKDNIFANKSTQYSCKGPAETHYFKQIDDLTRNLKLFGADEKEYVQILGNSTIELLTGWVEEVGQARWDEINKNPAIRAILDSTIYKIKLQLANAQLYKDEYDRFNQSIELIHNELAILLELTSPFEQTDFSHIYRAALRIVPPSLQPFVRGGIAKTAMNVYTGIESALTAVAAKENRKPVRAYCNNLYYESVAFMGQSHPIEDAINNGAISHIDHYSTQFNSNIQVDSTHTDYEVTDVSGDIQKLLLARPNAKHLTISVDCTIDYFNSPKVAALLAIFEDEIKMGKLNFVFFRSGQKFEMLGMDNYYGAPYYIVNNQQPQWDSFNEVLSSPAFQTDPLSTQWFCLANRYAADSLDTYRNEIFKNSREILSQISPLLKPDADPTKQRVRVNNVSSDMDVAFIDLKISGKFHRFRSKLLMGSFLQYCIENGIKSDSRGSFGFSHPNITNISVDEDDTTSLRITPGINREENEFIVNFINQMASS